MKHSWLWAAAVLAAALLAGPARAENDEGGKGKGKGKSEAKPNIVQIDLSKLPPDVAKMLMKYAVGQTQPEKGPPAKTAATPQPKGPPAGKGKAAQIPLPRGLAKKPANHPGRLNYIKAHSGQAASGKAATSTTKKKKAKDDDDD